MKISQQKVSRKHWLTITLVIIIIAASVGVSIYALRNKASEKPSSPSSESTSSSDSSSKINTDVPTPDEIDAGNSTKANNAVEEPSPSTSKTLSITANNAGSTIQIRSTITTTQTENGTCSLVLTKGDTKITKDTVGVQALPGYSTCKGWDIDVSTLSPGSWTATVTATYDSTPNTATAEFKI